MPRDNYPLMSSQLLAAMAGRLVHQLKPLAKQAQARLVEHPSMEPCAVYAVNGCLAIQSLGGDEDLLMKQASRVFRAPVRKLHPGELEAGYAIKLAVSPFLQGLDKVLQLQPWQLGEHKINPRPLTSMLAGGALMGGAGYLAGYGFDTLMGHADVDDRGRRTGAMMGAMLGAAPGAAWLGSRFLQRPSHHKLSPALLARYALAPTDQMAFAKLDPPMPKQGGVNMEFKEWRDESEADALDRIDAIVDGKNVGYLTSHPATDGGVWLKGMKVAPEHRGQGIGSALMQRAIDKYGEQLLSLRARPYDDKPMDQAKLQAFYAKYGFEPYDNEGRMRREPMRKEATMVKRRIGDYEAEVDRPKGFEKTFQTPRGPEVSKYPVDYGYLKGLINPDDNEDLDVFFGSGGPHFGRFMKGKTLSGTWEPDERKWYHGLTDEELEQVRQFYTGQDPTLLQDDVKFDTEEDWLADASSVAKKNASAFSGDFSVNTNHLGQVLWEGGADPQTLAAAMSAAQVASMIGKDIGSGGATPHQFGLLGAAIGAAGGGLQGYVAGNLVGKGLGLLTVLPPGTQQEFGRAGLTAGIASSLMHAFLAR